MTVDQSSEFVLPLDPFWLAQGERVRQLGQVIKVPQTRVGEEEAKKAFNNTVFLAYERLQPVFASLVSLMEYDEIGKAGGDDLFADATSQRIILKGFKILVEDRIKESPSPGRMKYEDYRPFFKGIQSGLNDLEKRISTGGALRNVVNSMAMVFRNSVNELRGVSGFEIKMEEMRGKISQYLPELQAMEDGQIVSAIKGKLTQILVPS